MMFSEFDRLAMTRALALAERGLETTHPNPRVGCVIAKGERIIAEGWHERAGEAHAEIAALRAAKEPVAGATAYVTLEPCSHFGRTPPCVNALIEARIGRVVFAVQDPNPRVSGQGAEALLRAGIAVEAGLMEVEAAELNIGFMKRMKHGLPWVRIKLAMSLDGRTALANGASQWITGEAARNDVQRWRARCSAVMTGVGTLLADDPQLNVRTAGFKGRQPLRVVLDSYLRSPPSAKMFVGLGAATAARTGSAAAHPVPPGSAAAAPASAGPAATSAAGADAIGEVLLFAALRGGIPTAKSEAPRVTTESAGLSDDMAELVKAFETSPSSVVAPRSADVSGPASNKSQLPSSSAPPPPSACLPGDTTSAPAPKTTTAAASADAPMGTASLAAGPVPGAGHEPAAAASAPDGVAAEHARANATASALHSVGEAVATLADDATWAGAALSGAAQVPSHRKGPPGGPQQPPVLGSADAPTNRTAASIGDAGMPRVGGAGGIEDRTATSGRTLALGGGPGAASSTAGGSGTAKGSRTAAAAVGAGAPGGNKFSAVQIQTGAPAANVSATTEGGRSQAGALRDSPAAFEARRAQLLARGVRIEEVPADDGYLDLFAVLQKLAQLEVNEVLVEAGPTLAGQLLTTFFADELLLYIAPKLLGPQGRPLVNLPELQSLQDAWGFSLFDAKRFGDDLRLRLRSK